MHNDQATRANIAAQNALVDHAIGRVVDALDAGGLTDDTLVIMTTDQGNPYGQRGLWGHPHVDRSAVHARRHLPASRSSCADPGAVAAPTGGRPTSCRHYDLLPTILDHVGSTDVVVEGSPGRSFAPVLSGGADRLRRRRLGVLRGRDGSLDPHAGIPLHAHLDGTGKPELYDLVADPEQWINVATEPTRADTVARLDEQLSAFFAEHADPRYDLWNGGTGQAMVSRYLLFKERYGPDWEVTTEVGPTYEG